MANKSAKILASGPTLVYWGVRPNTIVFADLFSKPAVADLAQVLILSLLSVAGCIKAVLSCEWQTPIRPSGWIVRV
jgi:hypothetical protein